MTASLTTTGERQSLPQLTEQYNKRSGRPAVLTITRGGGRQVLDHRRLLEPIGNIPPAEAEEQYYAAADQISMAA